MCSLLCSTDTVAAVSLLDPLKQPKLFSIVFGEGIVNDGVVIILFNAVNKFTFTEMEHEEAGFTMHDAGNLLIEFISLGIMSVLFGALIGFLCAYILKRWRSLTNSPVSECSVIFCFAYFCYVGAELLALSGIICLLTCSIIQAKFAWYNLSPQGRIASVVTFEFVGLLATGFVFSYLGITFFFYQNYMWSS